MSSIYKCILFVLVSLMVGVLYSFYVPSAYGISLGNADFCIPQGGENLSILDQSQGSLLSFSGADTSTQGGGSFQVTLSPKLVKNEIEAYETDDHGLLANLVINLKSLPESELKTTLSGKRHESILRLQEEYAGSNVSLDNLSGHYRVSWSAAPPPYIIWHVLDQEPSPELRVPSALSHYYIAYCSRAGGAQGESSNCLFYERYNTFLLTVTTSEENLALKPELISFARKKLNEWAGACAE